MNLIDLFDEAARRTPQAAAIIEGPSGAERVTSFAQLQLRSRQIAAQLAQGGVRRGDGVVLLIPMSASLYAVIAAVLRLGAVAVFIEPEQAEIQLERARTALKLKAFVGTPQACLLRWFRPELRAIPGVWVTQGWFPGAQRFGTALPALAERLMPADLDDEPAMLTFTSGSTGIPKGLLRSHRLLLETQKALIQHLGLRPGSINMATMPALVMANLGQGVTSLIPPGNLRRPGALNPARIAASLQRWQAESLLASPALGERLARFCLESGQTLPALRAVFMGGAPVLLPTLLRMAQAAPDSCVAALYGSTEAEPMALIWHDDIGAAEQRMIASGRGLPAGKPVQEIELAVMKDAWGQAVGPFSDADRATLFLPAGQIGEVVVSGAHVSSGYLGGMGDSETKFRIGHALWHRTGDSGWIDEHGRLWLTGRCSARVGEGTQGLYPLRVEAALAEWPELARSAFVYHHGQRLLVLELARKDVMPDMTLLIQTLAWADIQGVVFLPHIPVDRRHNAKIDYPALQRELEAWRCQDLMPHR